MIRKMGKAQKIAEAVMKKKGVKLPKGSSNEQMKLKQPYLQH